MQFPAPSLIDRLTDNNSQSRTESAFASELSPRRMQAALRRDIMWLLTTIRLGEVEDLSAYAHIPKSVINFGVRDLSGVPEQNLDPLEIEAVLREAIWNFEPRLDRDTVRIDILPLDNSDMRGVMKLRISGRWNQDIYGEAVLIEARINFDTGGVELMDGMGA